mgnify:FL=1
MIVDTHCHLTDKPFDADRESCVERCLSAGVERIVVACCDETEAEPIHAFCAAHPGFAFPSIGIHPENMAEDVEEQFREISRLYRKYDDWTAIGEIGLDLHWDKTRLEDQKRVLTLQWQLAVDEDLPVLLHVRDAMGELLALLPSMKRYADDRGRRLRGILHCYSGTAGEADEALRWGDFLFGIGGTLTYKHSQVPDIARHVGIDRIVLETDAPYLAPMPYRGRRNEPSYTALTATALAEILGTERDETARITTQNAAKLFYWDLKDVKNASF